MKDYKIVQLSGGLGNQMFQYAFAKSLSKHLDSTILLDKMWFEDEVAMQYDIFNNGCKGVRYGLDIFNIDLDFATKEQIQNAKKRLTRLPGFFRKLLKKEKWSFTRSEPFDFHEEYLKPNPYTYFAGHFQSVKYFEGIEAEIKQIFTPPPPYTNDDSVKERLAKITKATNSVFIHIRRGDYYSLSWQLEMDYYKKAIAYIQERVENPTFFVFGATDADFVEKLDLGVHFENLGQKDVTQDNHYYDMFLMSACKYGIIANSTYSWWGAYLGRQKDIVIAPTGWIPVGVQWNEIIPKEWVKIESATKKNPNDK